MFQIIDTKTESLSSVTYTLPNSHTLLINQPEYSEWTCQLFGMGDTITVTPTKDKVPNWFWRKMQYICFGNKWIKKQKF